MDVKNYVEMLLKYDDLEEDDLYETTFFAYMSGCFPDVSVKTAYEICVALRAYFMEKCE